MLKKLQEEQKDWGLKNFGPQPSYRMLLGIVEEVGELAHAHLKSEQGIRINEDHNAAKEDAIGDIVTYLAGYCNSENIDLESTVKRIWNEVKKRDWTKNKKTGEVIESDKPQNLILKTLDEVIEYIINSILITNKNKEVFRDISITALHHGFGTNLRNDLRLWHLKDDNPDLYKHFAARGLIHADDISKIIILQTKSVLRGDKNYNFNSNLINIWKHWKKQDVTEYLPPNIGNISSYYLNLYNNNVK